LWLGSGLGFWVGLGLDLRSWLFTHSWRSDAISFLLAYCQIADLTLALSYQFLLFSPDENYLGSGWVHASQNIG